MQAIAGWNIGAIDQLNGVVQVKASLAALQALSTLMTVESGETSGNAELVQFAAMVNDHSTDRRLDGQVGQSRERERGREERRGGIWSV